MKVNRENSQLKGKRKEEVGINYKDRNGMKKLRKEKKREKGNLCQRKKKERSKEQRK